MYMNKINLLIITLVVLIFIGISNSQIYETIIIREPPHLLRRLGLAPRYCPYRDSILLNN